MIMTMYSGDFCLLHIQGDVELIFSPSAVILDQISSASISIDLAAVAEEITASHQNERVIYIETPLVEVSKVWGKHVIHLYQFMLWSWITHTCRY